MAQRTPNERSVSAPGDLEILRDLLNTRVASGDGGLSSIEAAEAWLRARDLLPAELELTVSDRLRMLEVRDGLWALTTLPRGARPEERVVSDLRRALGDVRYELVLDAAGRPDFVPVAAGFDAVIASLASIAFRHHQHWWRLKICGACGRVFYDGGRGTAKWCTLRCGDRERGRKYRTTDGYRLRVASRRKKPRW